MRSRRLEPIHAWLGRKDWLAAPEHQPIYLDALRDARTYREPFAGSLGFYLAAVCALERPPPAVLSDTNLHLIHMLKTVREMPDDLAEQLAGMVPSPETFEAARELLNQVRRSGRRIASDVERAAAFVAVCQWGFNGLYRENQEGMINHPPGFPPKPLPTAEHLLAVGNALDDAILRCEDFETACARAEPGDFVYLDPPFDGTFTGYTATSGDFSSTKAGAEPLQPALFAAKDTLPTTGALARLQSAVEHLDARGALFLLSQADTEVVRAMFGRFEILEVEVRRSVAAKGSARGKATELLIRNYGPGFET